MVTEFAYLFIWSVSGLALARALELRGSIAVPIGFALGIALFVVLGVAQIVANVSTRPVWALMGTLIVGLAAWLWKARSRPSPKQWLALALSGLALLLFVFGLRELNWIGWHSDTFRYTLAGGLLGIDRADLITLNLITKRMAVYPLLLAPASDSSELHFAAFAPLLAVATLWTLAWLLWHASSTHPSVSRSERALAVVFVLALLVTNNRFIWHASYLNGHLVFAAFFAVAVGLWLVTRAHPSHTACCLHRNSKRLCDLGRVGSSGGTAGCSSRATAVYIPPKAQPLGAPHSGACAGERAVCLVCMGGVAAHRF